jgi:hypothetical protein
MNSPYAGMTFYQAVLTEQHCDDTIIATPTYAKLNSCMKLPKTETERNRERENILSQNENSIQRRLETQLCNIIAITLFKNFNHKDCDDSKQTTDAFQV